MLVTRWFGLAPLALALLQIPLSGGLPAIPRTLSPQLPVTGATASAAGLRVFFIDVEGGQATLFVTPTGQSLLIDTGWPGHNGRDAGRIAAAAHAAGLTRIDHVLITHFHTDHVGGVPQLVERIPVGAFLDHGPNLEHDHGITERGYAEYEKVLAQRKVKHQVLHAGDSFAVGALQAQVVSGAGAVRDKPLPDQPGAGQPNPFCAASPLRSPDDKDAEQIENQSSLGLLLRFGALRLLDLGDLTWEKERALMCPVNRLGKVDVLIVSHHGWDHSSSPALVDAVGARVAVMDNGAKKGGSPLTFETLAQAPGLEDLWQLHYAEAASTLNRPAAYVANSSGPDAARWIELDAKPDGSFTVSIQGRSFTKTYAPSRP